MKKPDFLLLLTGLICTAVFASCSGTLENKITVTTENEFPVITLPHTTENVVFKPSGSNTGSIGFEINNHTEWLKGLPEVSKQTDSTVSYTWLVKQNEITVSVLKSAGDFTLHLSSSAETKPDKWLINISAEADEFFTGVFERVVDGKQDKSWADGITRAMNLHGTKMDVRLKPTVSAYAPFYLSSNNYGFYVHGTWPGEFDFCNSIPELVQAKFEGPELNVVFYMADNPMQVVQKHALESGPSFIPPQWAFGPWRWRDQHFNKPEYYDGTRKNAPYNTDMVEDVLMMEALEIPVTAQWIDRPWGPGLSGFDDYEFDESEFPDPDGMIQWLQSKNQELMIWIAPFVMGDMGEYARDHNYNLVSKNWFKDQAVLMDFTNKEAVKWWSENGPKKLAKMGIKGFKLDRADGEKLTDSLHLKTSIGKSYRENYNDYPRQYVKATYDAVQPVLGDDFVLFPRAQYTGSARYGAMWAGDTNGKPEGLRSAIIALLRCSVIGYPNWGSDTGGYWGKFTRETTLRWLGFSCFSPIMEVGPTNNLAFWSNPATPSYDVELIAAWRLYSKIHFKLAPYIRKQSEMAHSEGTPIARPLFLEYPKQPEAWNDWQTYLFGPDILVSAIWQNKDKEHQLYLPDGETWIDAWDTKKEYTGGQYVKVSAPLHKIPVFIRKGSTIELGNLNEIYTESLSLVASRPDLKKLEAKEEWK